MLAVDGNGLPLGFHLDSANVAEVKLAEQTLDTIQVVPPEAVRSADHRSSWRVGGMIVARSALRCVEEAFACASRPSDVRRSGRPNAAVQSWRARTTIGNGTR